MSSPQASIFHNLLDPKSHMETENTKQPLYCCYYYISPLVAKITVQ